MRDIIKLGLILLIITSIAAFVLGITNDITQAIIVERAELENIEYIRALLPEAEDFVRVEDENVINSEEILQVYEGTKNGEIVGYTVKTNPQGYNGRIELLIGMSIDGKIVGVKVGEHTETPGLGSKIADGAFINQYTNKETVLEFSLTKDNPVKDADIQAITGATVSCEAANRGINRATQLFEDILKNR